MDTIKSLYAEIGIYLSTASGFFINLSTRFAKTVGAISKSIKNFIQNTIFWLFWVAVPMVLIIMYVLSSIYSLALCSFIAVLLALWVIAALNTVDSNKTPETETPVTA